MEGSSMIGLGVLLFLCIWGAIALLIANVIGKKLLKRFTKDAEGRTTSKGVLIILVVSVLVFFAPIADEIISYPAYSKMCQDAGKYEFAPNMDEKKVFGREYRIEEEDKKLIRLFPTFQTLHPEDNSNFGVVIEITKLKLIDDNTNETLLTTRTAKPLRSFFAMPWDGKRIPWLLHECSDVLGKNGGESQKYIRSLQMRLKYHLN
jgi:hypothetical protein